MARYENRFYVDTPLTTFLYNIIDINQDGWITYSELDQFMTNLPYYQRYGPYDLYDAFDDPGLRHRFTVITNEANELENAINLSIFVEFLNYLDRQLSVMTPPDNTLLDVLEEYRGAAASAAPAAPAAPAPTPAPAPAPKPECPICLGDMIPDDVNDPVVVVNEGQLDGRGKSVCGHYFHENCVNQAYMANADCPICRTPLQSWRLIIANEPILRGGKMKRKQKTNKK